MAEDRLAKNLEFLKAHSKTKRIDEDVLRLAAAMDVILKKPLTRIKEKELAASNSQYDIMKALESRALREDVEGVRRIANQVTRKMFEGTRKPMKFEEQVVGIDNFTAVWEKPHQLVKARKVLGEHVKP